MNELSFSWEGVRVLLEYHKTLKTAFETYYQSYTEISNMASYEAEAIGYDADEIETILQNIKNLLDDNVDLILEMMDYCHNEAIYMATLLEAKIGVVGDPYSTIPAEKKIFAYMSSHNYGRNDEATYMKDPEWIRLRKRADEEARLKDNKNIAKDIISGKIQLSTNKFFGSTKKTLFREVTELQGFRKEPTLVNEQAFDDMVKSTGLLCVRTWSNGEDIHTNQIRLAKEYKEEYKHSNDFSTNGSGPALYGMGLYVAANANPIKGSLPELEKRNDALENAWAYAGYDKSEGVLAQMTLSHNAQIIDEKILRAKYNALSYEEQDLFKDIGVYAAALGYDAIRCPQTNNVDYYTILNRGKVIMLDD